MMVPRAFLFTSVPSPDFHRHEKLDLNEDVLAIKDTSRLDCPKEVPSQSPHTSPMVIPPKRGPRNTSALSQSVDKRPQKPHRRPHPKRSSSHHSDRPMPSSIASVLEATAIPVPRRGWKRRDSQKLPRGNHVQDFSKLLMDGVKSRDDKLLEGTGNSTLDLLLSPPEENDKSAGSEYDSEALSFSARSVSDESTPSLDHDLETPSSFPGVSTPTSNRSPLEKRYRRASHCESCAFDHPLLDNEPTEPEWEPSEKKAPLPEAPAKPPSPPSSRSFPRIGSSFKSNLTASLRAIKNAAQSMSAFASPSVQPEDFLTRSLFTITPEMTDDRRPPPMNEPPSPALRRYLNPVTASPAEMYAYHDYPHESLDPRNCPVSVQMQTYRRTGKRGSRKSGFHLAGDGRFDPEALPISRQREPRENSNFLRMVVLEMNMRRSGKLRNDIPTRAKVALPPRKGNQSRRPGSYDYDDDHEEENTIPSRWVGISAEQ